MDDEHAHHADAELHHLIGVGVVHVGTVLLKGEFVGIRFPRFDMRLRQTTDPVHAAWQIQAVPVHRGRFAKAIGDENAHAIAFDGPGVEPLYPQHLALQPGANSCSTGSATR